MGIINNRIQYYQQSYLLYEMAKCLKHRYLSVRRADPNKKGKFLLSRYYQGYNVDLLKDALNRTHVLTDPTAKVYRDVATWVDENGNTPLFSFDVKERKKQKEEFSKKEGWKKYIKTYDFVIDLDAEKIKDAWNDAKVLKDLFDEYKLSYILKYSGGKGFHLEIDAKFIRTAVKPINRAGKIGKIVENIKEDLRLSTVDMSIYDSRRIIKMPYSLQNNNGKEYVCLPLDDNQFNNFKVEDMEMTNVLRKVRFFKRGMLERTHNLTEAELKMNMKKFMGEYK